MRANVSFGKEIESEETMRDKTRSRRKKRLLLFMVWFCGREERVKRLCFQI